jgi:hypothetical protein
MRKSRALIVVALAGLAAGILAPAPLAAQGTGRDSIQLSGRSVRCKNVRVVTDSHLPSEGAASPGRLILNPRMLSEQPPTVRLFVFHHECGHHSVGESELGADCWAVEQGVRDGWLDAKGLTQVCQSFEDAPATPTHPSGRRRCLNLDRCFATAVAAVRAKPAPATAATPAALSVAGPESAPPPRLVSGPTLVGTGTSSYAGAAPCRDGGAKPVAARPSGHGGCQ